MAKEKQSISIRLKLYFFIIAIILTVVVGTSVAAYKMNAAQIDGYYKQSAADNAYNCSTMVDGDYLKELRRIGESEEYQAIREQAEEEENDQLVRDYLEEKGMWEEYSKIRRQITNYKDNINDIKYIYIIAHGDKDADHDMYLIDDESTSLTEFGYYEERETELMGMDLTALPEPTISNGDWGWLCSDFKPVYASDGSCVCIVGCDIGMDDVMKERKNFRISLIIATLLLTAVVLFCAMLFINKTVVRPLHKMTLEMKKFKPSEHSDYEEAGVMELDIVNRDEIGEIYSGIRTMQMEIIDYLNDLSQLQEDKRRAEDDIKDKEKQIGKLSEETYRDALTGVGSKAAYLRKIEELNRCIAEGDTQFAMVMVDMNNLKLVNDAYGHKAGDLYIKGCCSMVCDAFKHSPVFRIGGDEFIVILQGSDHASRLEIFDKLKNDFEESYANEDADPWCRYSAALGMAEHASDDNTVELVFKRADKAMYDNKLKFKTEHGGYR